MSFRPDKFLEELYKSNKPKYSFNFCTEDEWLTRRKELKDILIEKMGSFPEEKIDLKVELIKEVEFADYIRQRVIYKAMDFIEVPAYILIPKLKQDKYPTILACHGHGYGSREIVGLNTDGSGDNFKNPGCNNNFALELVKKGFLVLVPEFLGFGDCKLEDDKEKAANESSCYQLSTTLMMYGKTLAGARVYQALRALDYLSTRIDVDQNRIGIMGFSGGGLVAAFATAIEDRIKVAAIAGYTNTFKDAIMSVHHCIDNYIPGILKYAELPDIIGLIAPRPLFIESGKEDPIFPIKGVKNAYKKIKEIYKYIGAEKRLEKHFFEGGHQVYGERSYQWLEKWLKEGDLN